MRRTLHLFYCCHPLFCGGLGVVKGNLMWLCTFNSSLDRMVPQNWPSDKKKTTKAWNLSLLLFSSFILFSCQFFLNFLANPRTLYYVGGELNKISLVGEWHYIIITPQSYKLYSSARLVFCIVKPPQIFTPIRYSSKTPNGSYHFRYHHISNFEHPLFHRTSLDIPYPVNGDLGP